MRPPGLTNSPAWLSALRQPRPADLGGHAGDRPHSTGTRIGHQVGPTRGGVRVVGVGAAHGLSGDPAAAAARWAAGRRPCRAPDAAQRRAATGSPILAHAHLRERVRERQWSTTGSAAVQPRATLDEVRAALDDETALLSYVFAGESPRGSRRHRQAGDPASDQRMARHPQFVSGLARRSRHGGIRPGTHG